MKCIRGVLTLFFLLAVLAPVVTGYEITVPCVIDAAFVAEHGTEYQIAGNWTGDTSSAILITAPNVTIDGQGYTLTGTDKMPYKTAVLVYGDNVTVRNLTAIGWHDGLIFGNVIGGLVENVSGYENVIGVTWHNASQGAIRTCDFSDNSDTGILLHLGSCDNLIELNHADRNGIVGINLNDGCSRNEVRWNQANDNPDTGILTYAGSDENILLGNVVVGNLNNGFDIWSDRNTITENYAAGNHGGVYLDGACNNTIAGNLIENNRDGGVITSHYSGLPSEGNLVERNTIRGVGAVWQSSQNIGVILYTAGNQNTVRSNQIVGNNGGILLHDATGNLIYDNRIENGVWDVLQEGTVTGTVWNISKTARTNILGGRWTGGNYWTGACASGTDGFCSQKQIIISGCCPPVNTGQYDRLPLAVAQPTPTPTSTPTPEPTTILPTTEPTTKPTPVPTLILHCTCTLQEDQTYLCSCVEGTA